MCWWDNNEWEAILTYTRLTSLCFLFLLLLFLSGGRRRSLDLEGSLSSLNLHLDLELDRRRAGLRWLLRLTVDHV